jgi:hypothetical protein
MADGRPSLVSRRGAVPSGASYSSLPRRRLTNDDRVRVLHAVGATHVVGEGDVGPSLDHMWRTDVEYAWGSSDQPHPLVLLTRSQPSSG